jgi:hypothetical protein
MFGPKGVEQVIEFPGLSSGYVVSFDRHLLDSGRHFRREFGDKSTLIVV